jgi:hypothetical protein
VRLSPLCTAATTGLLYQLQMMDDGDCGPIGGMKIRRGNRSTRRKPTPAPLCPPQIPHDTNRTRTRTTVVGSQRLTAGAMARPLTTEIRSDAPTHTYIYIWESNKRVNVPSPARPVSPCLPTSAHTITVEQTQNSFHKCYFLLRYCSNQAARLVSEESAFDSLQGQEIFFRSHRPDRLWSKSRLLSKISRDSLLGYKTTRAWSWPLQPISKFIIHGPMPTILYTTSQLDS